MENPGEVSRRQLLARIGTAAGSAVMYQAMTVLGLAADSGYRGPIKLEGDPKGAKVLILGAGIAGLVAALELRKAGYHVEVLEYNDRVGGRSWSLRGGDRYVELGGAAQRCEFDAGLYFNPGPWRIPYHHGGLLDYCRRLNVALEPFVQVNYNAYVHARDAFGGKPQRYREVVSDFHGNIAELLAKSLAQDKLDQPVSADEKQALLAALRAWGALDADYRYRAGLISSDRRGYAKDPGGGLSAEPMPSRPLAFGDLLRSGVWRRLGTDLTYEYQTTMFQPVGGMDMIPKAFGRAIGDVVRYNAKVTEIHQDDHGVTVTYVDATRGGTPRTARADWCLCTIPLSILSQIPLNVGAAMSAAIDAVPYGPGLKVGLQFRRRFWEQDEAIYGGITYTDLPIWQIGYPSTGYNSAGKGILLGAYPFWSYAFELTSLPPVERVKKAVAWGAQIHPQYQEEFENGIAVGWHRVPWSLGCFGLWSDAARREHYKNLCAIDGRIVLAGEHASYLPAWQEGALLSSLDAMTRLHQRVMAG
ncbi:MAG TPA: NAD(P)/FAD-dependent oxidoreductase [Xanthobacteraceae bacterium]|nr:NAD(P)/FAD-dependent oxidoreductase [Xanthobacteraceae bacterium]